MMITSTSNAAVKRVIQLQKKARTRRQEQQFAAEGWRLCREVPLDLMAEIYYQSSFPEREEQAAFLKQAEASGAQVVEVSDAVLGAMSDTKTPQGVIAVCRMPRFCDWPDAVAGAQGSVKEAPFFLLLEDIQDPGNLGTMLRTAEGAGAGGVFLSGGCVDAYSPKVVRATMGSLFRVPHWEVIDWEGTVTHNL